MATITEIKAGKTGAGEQSHQAQTCSHGGPFHPWTDQDTQIVHYLCKGCYTFAKNKKCIPSQRFNALTEAPVLRRSHG